MNQSTFRESVDKIVIAHNQYIDGVWKGTSDLDNPPKTAEAISNLVEEARIDELDRARTNTRPSILYGTNIKYSAVADSYLIDRLSDLKSNRE